MESVEWKKKWGEDGRKMERKVEAWRKEKIEMSVWLPMLVYGGLAEVRGKAVLPFDICLHYEVILFYLTLASWCNFLNMKSQKELYERR